MSPAPLDMLRCVVQDSMGKHLYDNAIFFADKLIALSDNDPDDVYRLTQAFLYTRQHRRALALLRRTGLGGVGAAPRFAYAAAKCHAECQEWDECVGVLSDEALERAKEAGGSDVGRISLFSAMLLLKGGVYESLENWSLAARTYTRALREEPLNFEAHARPKSHSAAPHPPAGPVASPHPLSRSAAAPNERRPSPPTARPCRARRR